jgi:site-specific recombinase XerD
LRVGEAVSIEVSDIRSAQGRLHLRNTKGGQERYVPISPAMIEELRAFWKTHRHPRWLFATEGAGHLDVTVVQRTMQRVRSELGLSEKVTPHTLRHCYASHLLEEGVSLRLISQFLGHSSLDTTAIYTHLTTTTETHARQALERLHQALGQ